MEVVVIPGVGAVDADQIFDAAILDPHKVGHLPHGAAAVVQLEGLRHRRIHRDPVILNAGDLPFVVAGDVLHPEPLPVQLVHVQRVNPAPGGAMTNPDRIAGLEQRGIAHAESARARRHQPLGQSRLRHFDFLDVIAHRDHVLSAGEGGAQARSGGQRTARALEHHAAVGNQDGAVHAVLAGIQVNHAAESKGIGGTHADGLKSAVDEGRVVPAVGEWAELNPLVRRHHVPHLRQRRLAAPVTAVGKIIDANAVGVAAVKQIAKVGGINPLARLHARRRAAFGETQHRRAGEQENQELSLHGWSSFGAGESVGMH